MSDLRIINLEKQYGQAPQKNNSGFSLKPVELTISEGEFFSLLGPSGCGKTTLLKLVAGLVQPDAGEIWIGDANVTAVPPEARRFRSEERRVGKECRYRWSRDQRKRIQLTKTTAELVTN